VTSSGNAARLRDFPTEMRLPSGEYFAVKGSICEMQGWLMDAEIRRLRRLRASALRVRAIARALARLETVDRDPILDRGRCAAWRVARTATGHLRAHPYLNFQRDAGVGTILLNSAAAAGAVLRAVNRSAAFRIFEAHLRSLSRELDDARALTWAADLSDALGRSQAEIRGLLATLTGLRAGDRLGVQASLAPASKGASVDDADWPYLAF